jgi:uncharacterized protein YndB with AHSA1/START domain
MLQPDKACLLIADISGYTEYLARVEIDHAQDILADLIGTVVTSLRPNFRLSKLEGDAAFCFAPAEKIDGSLLLDTIERCYFGFRRRRRDVRQATSCECNACMRIPDLNLKFAAHHGLAIRQKIAGREELLGSDVIVVHRLLKNDIVEKLGVTAYAALSDQLVGEMEIDPVALGMQPHAETYEHLGEVKVWVHDLERRWQEEDARERIRVGPEESAFSVSVEVSAPPQIVWEILTTPGHRIRWQLGSTAIEQETTAGGRRGVGMVNHCVHGADAIIEEIIDWRPYDYYTDRSKMFRDGPTVLSTVELEPTPTGTIVHLRFGRPQKAKDRALLEAMASGLGDGLRASLALLGSGAETEMSTMMADRSEPPLPQRSGANTFLDGLKPIQIVG